MIYCTWKFPNCCSFVVPEEDQQESYESLPRKNSKVPVSSAHDELNNHANNQSLNSPRVEDKFNEARGSMDSFFVEASVVTVSGHQPVQVKLCICGMF